MKGGLSILLAMLLLCSCGITQDVGYLRQKIANNEDLPEVENILIELRDDGYTEATSALADLYHKSGELEKLNQACSYYQELATESDRMKSRYIKCIAHLSYLDEQYRDKAHKLLLARQQSAQDVLPDLARFYSFHASYYNNNELGKLISEMQADFENNKISIAETLDKDPHPEHYPDLIPQLCTDSHDTNLQSLCVRLKLKIAKTNNDEDTVNKIVQLLKTQYDNSGSTELSELDEKTLYSCATILLKEQHGKKHITSGLQVAALGHHASPRLFLLSARYEHKRKILMPTDKLLSRLKELETVGNPDAALLLGRMYGEGYRVTDNPQQAEKYLKKISYNPKAALFLGRLYLSGKLGSERLQDGINTLLFAARNGEYQGYMDLAKAFNGFPGIKANPDYALVFAKMAATNLDDTRRTEEMKELMNQLQNRSDPQQHRQILEFESTQLKNAHLPFTVLPQRTARI